jgi:phage tail sheath protein FI
MATTYKTPGAYTEEIPKFPPSIAAVDTAIPAFIGYTERATDVVAGDLVLKPKRIESLVEYERYFGTAQPEKAITVTIDEVTDAKPGKPVGIMAKAQLSEASRSKHLMYYAMQMFYSNGGKSCYVVSVGPYKTLGTALVKTELEAGLAPLQKVDEPTLILFPEAQTLSSISDFASLQDQALTQCNDLKDRFVIMDVHGGAISMSDATANLITAVGNFRTSGPTQYLKYGAAYAPNIETVLDFAYDETTTNVTYVLNGTASAPVTMSALKSANNQRYELAKAAIIDLALKIPPSSTMAGIYAKTDNDLGVWNAPANVGLVNVIKPAIEFSNTEQDVMNVDPTAGKSVNAIRPFVGRGTLVWGARTLAGNDNEWRYVNVRRFFNFVEESVKKAAETFTFAPNDANTWVKVQAMIENFLTTQWRAGALQGVKPEHAFYVAVGLGKTMSAQDILEGRMIVEIGMAVVRPAEFIILRYSHLMAKS